jgi:type I restriction enzyme, S subunit
MLVLAVVSSDAFVAQAVQTSQGTKMPRANWSVLRSYPVPYPARRTLAAFDDQFHALIGQIQRLVLTIRTLGEARDVLLPRLISGGIEVDDLDIAVGEAAA